jgi:hypothetical protein
MGSTNASNGGSDTADEKKQKTYSEQLEDIQKKQREENLKTKTEFGYTKNKTKTKNQQNLAEHERVMRENRGNQVVQSPTTSEVSQVTETEQTTLEETTTEVDKTEEKEDDITIRKRKTKARGRSPTILTGVTGVTDGLTLGKPSLLGR